MIKEFTSFVLLFFWAGVTFGQDFYDELQTAADRTYNSSYLQMNVDSLNEAFFRTNEVSMQIDTAATYQVLFSDHKGFQHQSGPNSPCPCTYEEFSARARTRHLIDSTFVRTPNLKRYYEASETYKGTELVKNGVRFNTATITAFPEIRNNGDEYNARWTVFSNEEYLIFRFVSLYYGERYSYDETLIYLKKSMN